MFMGLEDTYAGLLDILFAAPALPEKPFGYPSRLYLQEVMRIASCIKEGNLQERLRTAVALIETTPWSIVSTLTGAPETFIFEVINGRFGSIATATIGGPINAATIYSIQYLLVAGGDWIVYTGGVFTGVEVNERITFVGVQNRIVYTPTGGADTTIMVAL